MEITLNTSSNGVYDFSDKNFSARFKDGRDEWFLTKLNINHEDEKRMFVSSLFPEKNEQQKTLNVGKDQAREFWESLTNEGFEEHIWNTNE